jgi:hypothetical protein
MPGCFSHWTGVKSDKEIKDLKTLKREFRITLLFIPGEDFNPMHQLGIDNSDSEKFLSLAEAAMLHTLYYGR